ncbi:MAG: DUF983 domain-containing protein [Bacteroidota bacterium]
MKQTSRWRAFVKGLCPKCRRGPIFSGSIYGFNIQRTHTNCSHCKQRFEIEPGYFYAAMYVSYAMNMIEMISTGFATYYLCNGSLDFDSLWLYVGSILLVSVILSPFNYRYSRIILLHWLSPKIKYDATYDQP